MLQHQPGAATADRSPGQRRRGWIAARALEQGHLLEKLHICLDRRLAGSQLCPHDVPIYQLSIADPISPRLRHLGEAEIRMLRYQGRSSTVADESRTVVVSSAILVPIRQTAASLATVQAAVSTRVDFSDHRHRLLDRLRVECHRQPLHDDRICGLD